MKENNTEFPKKNKVYFELLAQLHGKIRNLTLKLIYSFERWCQITFQKLEEEKESSRGRQIQMKHLLYEFRLCELNEGQMHCKDQSS